MMFNLRELSKECAKALLILMNVFCMFISLITFAFAVVDCRVLKQYGEEQAWGTFAGDLSTITVCIFLFSTSMVCCVGVVKERPKLLYLYVGLIMVLVLLELMDGIFVAVQRCGVYIRVQDRLREDFFKNVTGEELTLHEKFWDDLQTNYECCGLNGPDDYISTQRPVSMSCCPIAFQTREPHAQKQLFNSCVMRQAYYQHGCEHEVLYVLETDTDWLLGFAVLSFLFETTGLFLAMYVAKSIENSVTVYQKTVKY
ncbi:tetraspanin family domain-containing protein [Phthorimaea operculella]|nr:tetraspanin family domain-containing protein [Phthorimaea operculella]